MFADLVVAVNVGVMLAMLQFLRRMAESVETQPVDAQGTARRARAAWPGAPARGVLVYAIDGPAVLRRGRELRARSAAETRTDPRVLVLRLRRVPFIDITGLQTLEEVIGELRERGVRVMMCEANERVLGKLRRAGVVREREPDAYLERFDDVLHTLDPAGPPAPPHSHGLGEFAQRLLATSRAYLHRDM